MLKGTVASAVAVIVASTGPRMLSITPAGNAGSNNSNTTDKFFDLPAVLNVGDRLITVLAIDGDFGAPTVDVPPDEFAELVNSTDSTSIRGVIYWKDADGSEGGTTVGLTLSAGQYMSGHTYRIAAGTFDATKPPEFTTTPSWELANTLWIAAGMSDQNPGISAYPLPNGQTYLTTGGASGDACASYSCWQVDYLANNDAAVDTGFTFGGGSNRLGPFMIAVAPIGLGLLVTYEEPSPAPLNDYFTTSTPVVLRGAAPYVFTLQTGTLPDGLDLNASTGEISGYATEDGSFPVTVRCTDDDSQTFDADLALVVEVFALEVTGTYDDGTVAGDYSSLPAYRYGRQPYAFTLQAGSLPDGLALDPDSGRVSGTPSAEGSFSFTVRCTDDDENYVDCAATVEVGFQTLENFYTDPDWYDGGTVGEDYDDPSPFQYGHPPFVFTIESGSLPPGLLLDADTGRISGIPITPGSYSFTVRCTDDDAALAEYDGTIDIATP